jgi:hypothetical protein
MITGAVLAEHALDGIVGNGDRTLVERVLACGAAVKELDDWLLFLDPPTTTRELMEGVVGGTVETSRWIEYRRLIEVLAPVLGESVTPARMILPGLAVRTWGPVLHHWGMPTLGEAWSRPRVFFPFRENRASWDWPKTIFVRPVEAIAALAELRAFDPRAPGLLRASGDPAVDDLLTQPGEPLAEPGSHELEYLMDGLQRWLSAAGDRGLLICLDGDS